MRQPELAQNEVEVWSGHPSPMCFAMDSISLTMLGATFVIGGLLFCLFSFQIEAAAEEVWPCLLPLVISLVGLGMISIFPWRYIRARKLSYHLTSDRAIVYDQSKSRIIESYEYESFPDASAVMHSNGSCDIIFKTEVRATANEEPSALEKAASTKQYGLIGIEDGAEAMQAFSEIREACLANS